MKMATLGSLLLLVVACVAAAEAEDNWLVGYRFYMAAPHARESAFVYQPRGLI